MIVIKNFDWRKMVWNIRFETFITFMFANAIYARDQYQVLDIKLLYSNTAILDLAMAKNVYLL